MGKFGSPQIGVFSPDGNDYDDPNLNKCINCGALFQGKICPICKTVCVPEMMAGMRKAKESRNSEKKKSKAWIVICVVIAAVCALVLVPDKLPSKISAPTPNEMIAAATNAPKFDAVTNTPKFDKESYDNGIGYEELYRYPEKYRGEKTKITGMVFVAVDGNPDSAVVFAEGKLSEYICITYTDKESEARLMSGDLITIYGTGNGLFEYELGSMPWVSADLIEFFEYENEESKTSAKEETTAKPEPKTVSISFDEPIDIGTWRVTITKYAISSVGQPGTAISDINSIRLNVKIKNLGSEKRKIANDMSFYLVYDGKYTYEPETAFGINDAVPVMGNDEGYYYFYIPKEICESDMRVEAVIIAKDPDDNEVIYRAEHKPT